MENNENNIQNQDVENIQSNVNGSKKLTIVLLIIVLILLLATGIGGGFLLTNKLLSDKNNEKSNTTNSANVDNTKSISEQEMYEDIIKEYKDAQSEFDLENEDSIISKYKMVNSTILYMVTRYKEYNQEIAYTYYDIDKNGIKELIVGVGDKSNNGFSVGAIYSYNPNSKKAEKIYFQDTMERGNLDIYDNGILFSAGSGGAALHIAEFGKIGANGYSYEQLEWVEEEINEEGTSAKYTELNTKKVLDYKSWDEMTDKYLKNAKKVKFTEFETIKSDKPKNENKTEEKSPDTEYDKAVSAIKAALKDKTWVNENVSLKYDWGGAQLSNIESQKHTFMVLKNTEKKAPIVVVYTADSPEEYTGSYKLFIVSYENGKVISTPMTANSNHASHCYMQVDPNNKIAKYSYGHMSSGLDLYLKIYSDKVEELDKFEYEFSYNSDDLTKMIRENFVIDGKSVTENEIKKIEDKYSNCKFYNIETELTDSNIDEYVK